MTTCAYIKPGGERCRAFAQAGFSTCYGHRPDLAKERQRNASKGGRSGGRGRPQTETDGLKREIRAVVRGVLAGEIPQGPGAVALQGYNTLLRACEQERRQEAGDHNLTPQELESFVAQVVDIVGHHVPPERLRGVVEELGAFIDEAAV